MWPWFHWGLKWQCWIDLDPGIWIWHSCSKNCCRWFRCVDSIVSWNSWQCWINLDPRIWAWHYYTMKCWIYHIWRWLLFWNISFIWTLCINHVWEPTVLLQLCVVSFTLGQSQTISRYVLTIILMIVTVVMKRCRCWRRHRWWWWWWRRRDKNLQDANEILIYLPAKSSEWCGRPTPQQALLDHLGLGPLGKRSDECHAPPKNLRINGSSKLSGPLVNAMQKGPNHLPPSTMVS
jgi:hypothetical protein